MLQKSTRSKWVAYGAANASNLTLGLAVSALIAGSAAHAAGSDKVSGAQLEVSRTTVARAVSQSVSGGGDNSSDASDPRIEAGFGSAPLPEGIDFAAAAGAGPLSLRNSSLRQDVYELRIPLASINAVPQREFGFEVQINDDDDGGERDAKWGWIHPSRGTSDLDFTWQNPSYMGTVILE